jgi:hypothetical protein
MARIQHIDMLDSQHPQNLPADAVLRYTLDHGWIEVRHKDTFLEITGNGLNSTVRLLIEPWSSNQILLSLEATPPADRPA